MLNAVFEETVDIVQSYISFIRNGQNSEIFNLFPSYYIEIDS